MYPCVHVNLGHIRHNASVVAALCQENNINITGVSKVFCGDPHIVQAYIQAGISYIGDSRVDNLMKMGDMPIEKWLIRPPQQCEVDLLVRHVDVSLNSELATLKKLNQASKAIGKQHKVILMADLGDIREGFSNYDELIEVAMAVEKMEFLHLYGIGTNLTCFSFVQPNEEKMKELSDLAQRISTAINRPLEIISGGNSATIDLMLRGGIDSGVNNLRLGESVLFGKERANYQYLPNTYKDAFILECEIVELKEKPSLPWGEIGVDSYGNTPSFQDKGMRLKAVCALGRQDFDVETSTPVDKGIIVLGASSDHLMLDVTDSVKRYQVGDIVQLQLGYFSTMRAYTSQYVEKVYHN